MRTRNKSYSDYGFEKNEEKKLKEYCRQSDFNDHKLLLDTAISVNPFIASDIYYSLVRGISYDDLLKVRYIPLPKSDFYGYQRKCLSMFRNMLLFYNKWK